MKLERGVIERIWLFASEHGSPSESERFCTNDRQTESHIQVEALSPSSSVLRMAARGSARGLARFHHEPRNGPVTPVLMVTACTVEGLGSWFLRIGSVTSTSHGPVTV